MERADEIFPLAADWLKRNAKTDNWFLHINLWDPHTPYRSPEEWIRLFADHPLPSWYTEEVRQQHWRGCGPHSAQEVMDFDILDDWLKRFPHQPQIIGSMVAAREMFDGYDAGVRFADEHIGRILNTLADQGVLDETAVILSSDHGENLGELNIYCDHQTADQITSRVPLIIRWSGLSGTGKARVDTALHYHVDFAATLVELLGGQVPDGWDGRGFAAAFKEGRQEGRDFLVLSQSAWTCQRSVRFGDHLCIRSYHDGYHAFPDRMLFNVKTDPNEQNDLAAKSPELVDMAMSLLDQWHVQMMRTATCPQDPMATVLCEGGPFHLRGELPAYLARLQKTGRALWADHLARIFHVPV